MSTPLRAATAAVAALAATVVLAGCGGQSRASVCHTYATQLAAQRAAAVAYGVKVSDEQAKILGVSPSATANVGVPLAQARLDTDMAKDRAHAWFAKGTKDHCAT